MSPSTESSPTRILGDYISTLSIKDIPEQHLIRAKHLILDGIACALIGAHLPHSEKAAKSIFLMEPGGGTCSVIGYPDHKLSPVNAALLNSTFIQGFELDDWHREAPLHSNSILIPALLAAAEHQTTSVSPSSKVSGEDILLAMVAGYETGPRVGNALYGRHILSMGWHSGAVFGPAAAAAAVGKLYGLDVDTLEDAFGIACTQACGLMSAQFESEVKRMQHGFAARNGLFAVLLARDGYVGIKKVFEREYGGFLNQFSQGNGKEPTYKVEELYKDLGEKWQIDGVCVKPYSSMAGTHATVDCIRLLQEEHPDLLREENLANIESIEITLDEPMFHHGGFEATRPLSATGAQMCDAYVAATQLVDREVMVKQFGPSNLDRDEVWSVVNKIKCFPDKTFADGTVEIRLKFKDGTDVSKKNDKQRGVNPPLSNEDIIEKFRVLAKQVIDEQRMGEIEELVLNLDNVEDIKELVKLLTPVTRNAFDVSETTETMG